MLLLVSGDIEIRINVGRWRDFNNDDGQATAITNEPGVIFDKNIVTNTNKAIPVSVGLLIVKGPQIIDLLQEYL